MALYRCMGNSGSFAEIMPSDSNPPQIQKDIPFKALDDGYAIKSYVYGITPRSTPDFVPMGDVLKFNANGYLVDDIDIVTPLDHNPPKIDSHTSCYNGESYDGYLVRGPVSLITPSNSSPAAISFGGVYTAVDSGYAIESYSSVTPSSTPVGVSSGDVVKFGGNGLIMDYSGFEVITPSNSNPPQLTTNGAYSFTSAGYAIASYSSKTPSNSNPPSVSNGEIVKAGGAGYLCATPGFPYKKSGTIPDFTSANQEQTVDTGLSEVKYVYVEGSNGNTLAFAQLDMDRPRTKQIAYYGAVSATNVIQSGNDASGLITGNTAYLKISAISGGQITFKGGNAANYYYQNVKWYAG